jgi:hypothetical protein
MVQYWYRLKQIAERSAARLKPIVSLRRITHHAQGSVCNTVNQYQLSELSTFNLLLVTIVTFAINHKEQSGEIVHNNIILYTPVFISESQR